MPNENGKPRMRGQPREIVVGVDDVRANGRYRKDLGDLTSLVASIEDIGLLHPIVVVPDGEKFRLIAGQRRLAAYRQLKRRVIPARIARNVGDLTKELRAQCDENTCRLDFTPSELVEAGLAIENLVKPLKVANHRDGSAAGGRKPKNGKPLEKAGGNSPSLASRQSRGADVAAAAVGVDRRTYEKAKAVAAYGDPDLMEQMDRTRKIDPAYREVKSRERTHQRRRELRARAKEAAAAVKADQPKWDLLAMDVMDGLQSVLDHRTPARLVFADPPYNIGVDYGRGAKADRLPGDTYMAWVEKWLGLCCDCLSEDGSLWVLIGDEYAAEYAVTLKRLGLTIRSWIKWYETFGVNCARCFNRTSRHLFYCVRDPRRFVFHADAVNRKSDRQTKYGDKRANPNGKIWDDVWGIHPPIPRLTGTCKERLPDVPTQLPLALLKPIIQCASDPGDLVVDPFVGSGTTGEACLSATPGPRKFIGIDSSRKFIAIARQRLEGVG